MNERELMKAKLATLAFSLVDAAGTYGDVQDVSGAGDAGLIGDISGAVTDQLSEAMEYVLKEMKDKHKPTKEGLNEYLRKSKLKISWSLFTSGLKIAKQQANLKGASKCIAESVEAAVDMGEFAVTLAGTPSGVGILVAAAQGVAMWSQLIAATDACGDVLIQGLSDLGRMTKREIDAFARLSGRVTNAVNRFIQDSVAELSAALNPDNYDFSALPKAAMNELTLGLLTPLRLYAAGGPLNFVKLASTTTVTSQDATRIANGIVLANSRANGLDALSAGQKADVSTVANNYGKLSYAAAFSKLREDLHLGARTR